MDRRAPRPPARQGQPASGRNFSNSSAGGVASTSSQPGTASPPRFRNGSKGVDEGETKRKKAAWGEAYVEKEDSIRNDYSTHYVRTGSRPQNHLRGAEVSQRFSEYPKLSALLVQKHLLHSSPLYSIPPVYLSSAPPIALQTLPPSRFDSILLTPPPSVTYEELRSLDLGKIAATPGFVWLWVGNGQRGPTGDGGGVGLEKGRELLAEWGYRRCEDIVWLKSNVGREEEDLEGDCDSLFTPTIEHCLMGIRGTVRRSNDPWLVHCNVDTDVLVWEGSSTDPLLKPPELQSLIENFCLGTRRLHLYGSSSKALRRGWLTVGDVDFTCPGGEVRPVEGEEGGWEAVEWGKEEYDGLWSKVNSGGGGVQDGIETLLPFVEELDNLRPKSPPPRNGVASSGGLGRGRGAGLGITRSGAAQQARSGPPSAHARHIQPHINAPYSSPPIQQNHFAAPSPSQLYRQPPPQDMYGMQAYQQEAMLHQQFQNQLQLQHHQQQPHQQQGTYTPMYNGNANQHWAPPSSFVPHQHSGPTGRGGEAFAQSGVGFGLPPRMTTQTYAGEVEQFRDYEPPQHQHQHQLQHPHQHSSQYQYQYPHPHSYQGHY